MGAAFFEEYLLTKEVFFSEACEGELSRVLNAFNPLKRQPGIYFFVNKQGQIVYVGQAKNDLKRRISQELCVYKKTDRGNNGATLNFNMQNVEKALNVTTIKGFSDFLEGWKVKVLRFDDKPLIPLNLIEVFFITIFDPKYNKAK